MAATYLDSSAIVKLAVEEPESTALRRHLRKRRPLVASALARTEVLRALLPQGEEGLVRGRVVLARLELIRVSDRVLNAAGTMLPADLRSLDAIHLATAADLGDELGTVISYDERMVDAARVLGLHVSSPVLNAARRGLCSMVIGGSGQLVPDRVWVDYIRPCWIGLHQK